MGGEKGGERRKREERGKGKMGGDGPLSEILNTPLRVPKYYINATVQCALCTIIPFGFAVHRNAHI